VNLDPTAFLMCSGCGHIASEPGPHMGMPAMGLECPRGGSSFYAINMADEGQALLWRRYVAEAAATYAACPECGGTRLRREARDVVVGGRTIDAVCALTVKDAAGFFAGLASP